MVSVPIWCMGTRVSGFTSPSSLKMYGVFYMEIEDDEILQGFIEESLEHLADIENDLLTVE